MIKVAEEISGWIKQQVIAAGKKGVAIGLSGGMDSAVTAALAAKALQGKVLGLILPCGNDTRDEELAISVAHKFSISVHRVDLYNAYNKLCENFVGTDQSSAANLKARLRMSTLYYFANILNYLVAGTINKSELMTGYFTKYGDGGCDILPLGGLLKREVRELAQNLHIPEEIIERTPGAGLWESQTEKDEIRICSEELDSCLTTLEKGSKPDSENKNLAKVELMVKNSQHKRNETPVFQKK